MDNTIDRLVRILDEERTGRNKADEQVATTLLQLLDSQLELQNERKHFDLRVKSIREEESYGYDSLRRDFDRLRSATLRMTRDFLAQSIFDEDPTFYTVNKIPFIRVLRERSGLGLKDSKDVVDEFLADRQAQAEALNAQI